MSKGSKHSSKISFQDFLPNSIKNGASRRSVSHSYTTQRLKLNNTFRSNVLNKPFIPEDNDIQFDHSQRLNMNSELGTHIFHNEAVVERPVTTQNVVVSDED
jgi:hypothetical protein